MCPQTQYPADRFSYHTGHVCTRIEIHFIAYYNSHTQTLSRHSVTIGIGKKVCFSKRPLPTLSSHAGPTQTLCGQWGALIGWPVVPNCSTRCLFSSWYGQVCCEHLSGPSTVCTTWSAVSTGIVNPPTHLLYATLMILQAVFKTSLKISQSIK